MQAGTPRRGVVALAALGVVYGDIGTSPLYAMRESLGGEHDLAIVEANVLGVLSLMIWSLVLVITVKYLFIVMRADNEGEGGILALASLVDPTGRVGARRLVLLGLFGTALLYGDGMITPAISVLSAVEGIEVAAPSVDAWVMPIAMAILVALFAIQHRGTEAIGRFFGPVMVLWFATLALLGVVNAAAHPGVLRAADPSRAVAFFADNGFAGYLVLGSVFLVVTGGEALYADMGHFGRGAIQSGWFAVVAPSLLLNYLGQGALLLDDPAAIENPFYLLAPSWAQWPLTVLATAATVIASQALITGAFSLTVQAINLDYLPRMRVRHTSHHARGQVYVPVINWLLLAACLALVAAFGSATRLASAYGVAVTMTMLITTLLVADVARRRWHWSRLRTLATLVPLAVVDAAFLGANVFKIPSGGWLPLVIGAAGFVVFTTWRHGRRLVEARIDSGPLSIAELVRSIEAHPVHRMAGTGVYLHRTPGRVPPVLLANLRHNSGLHEHVVLLSVVVGDAAHVPRSARADLSDHGQGFHSLEMHYGFAEEPHLGRDLAALTLRQVSFDSEHTTFFLGRERVESTERPGMARWREHLYAMLHRNASDPAQHFGLPRDRSVDIGMHVDI